MVIYSRLSIQILIIGGSGSGTRNALFNFISNQSDFDKMYLYTKDPYEAKYHFLITKKRKYRIKAF